MTLVAAFVGNFFVH